MSNIPLPAGARPPLPSASTPKFAVPAAAAPSARMTKYAPPMKRSTSSNVWQREEEKSVVPLDDDTESFLFEWHDDDEDSPARVLRASAPGGRTGGSAPVLLADLTTSTKPAGACAGVAGQKAMARPAGVAPYK